MLKSTRIGSDRQGQYFHQRQTLVQTGGLNHDAHAFRHGRRHLLWSGRERSRQSEKAYLEAFFFLVAFLVAAFFVAAFFVADLVAVVFLAVDFFAAVFFTAVFLAAAFLVVFFFGEAFLVATLRASYGFGLHSDPRWGPRKAERCCENFCCLAVTLSSDRPCSGSNPCADLLSVTGVQHPLTSTRHMLSG